MPLTIKSLKKIVSVWASGTGYRIRVYLYGSRLKGTQKQDSDLDLAIEFLDPLIDHEVVWYDVGDKWTKELSELTGLDARLLVLTELSEPVNTYVKECSTILFQSPPEPESPELRLTSILDFSRSIESSSDKTGPEDESGTSSCSPGRRGGNRGRVS